MAETPTKEQAAEAFKALESLMAREIASDALDANRVRQLGNSIAVLVPKEERERLQFQLNESAIYSDKPEQEKAAAVAAVRTMMRTISARGAVKPDTVKSIESNMVTWLGGSFSDSKALQDKIAADITPPDVMRDEPDTSKSIKDSKMDARVRALDKVIARVLDAKAKSGELSPATMDSVADKLRWQLPSTEGSILLDKIAESKRYPDADTQKTLKIQAYRDSLTMLTMRRQSLDAETYQSVEKSLAELTGEKPEGLRKLVDAEVAAPTDTDYPVPQLAAGTKLAQTSIQEMNAYEAVVAKALDDNLTMDAANPKKIPTAKIRDFARSLSWSVSVDEHSYYSKLLDHTQAIASPEEQLRAVTSIARDLMHKHASTESSGFLETDLTATSAWGYLLKNRYSNEKDLQKAVVEQIANPSGPIPAPPALPGGEWKPRDLLPPPLETNSPADVAKAKYDLTKKNGFRLITKDELPGYTDPKTGKRVIAFTFLEDYYPEHVTRLAPRVGPMSKEREDMARRSMAEIANIANVEFVEVTDPGLRNTANIVFAQGTMIIINKNELNGFSSGVNSRNYVVMRDDTKPHQMQPGRVVAGTMTHELLHAIGFRHPGQEDGFGDIEGGTNKAYSRRGSVMSYNHAIGSIHGIGPMDIALLQDDKMYGKSSRLPVDKTYTTDELVATSTIYSEGTAKLDLRHPAFTGKVKVDMSSNLLYPISGTVSDGKGERPFDPRIAIGTNYEVLMDNSSRIAIDITGKQDAKLSGGGNNDVLTAFGGGNTLTGGKGRDTFAIGMQSGTGNTITDFNPGENDVIMVRPGATEVKLEASGTGTVMTLYKDTLAVSSVTINNASPETVRANMFALIDEKSAAPKIIMTGKDGADAPKASPVVPTVDPTKVVDEPAAKAADPAMPTPSLMSSVKSGVESTLDTVGTGTATGAAIGGIGGLLLTFLMKGDDGEGPGFFKSLLMVIAGAVLGGLVGGFANKDGPIFGDLGSPLPDGTKPDVRKIGVDAAPTSNTPVEFSKREIRGIFPGETSELSNHHMPRMLLKTGNVTDTSASFTGLIVADDKRQITLPFNSPVTVPVSNGQVDYKLAMTLGGLRMTEAKSPLASYIQIDNLDETLKRYEGVQLNTEQKLALEKQLTLSAIAKDGKISSTLMQRISTNATNPDGSLNTEFLRENATTLGLDRKRIIASTISGDTVNIATGVQRDDKTIDLNQAIMVDVRKIGAAALNNNAEATVSKLLPRDKSKDFDLAMLSAVSSAGNSGISYQKATTPTSIGVVSDVPLQSERTSRFGFVRADELRAKIKGIMTGSASPDMSVTSPDMTVVVPPLAGMPLPQAGKTK